jgi:hypothetical protein
MAKPQRQVVLLSITKNSYILYSGISSLQYGLSCHNDDDALKPSDTEIYVFVCIVMLRENITRMERNDLN